MRGDMFGPVGGAPKLPSAAYQDGARGGASGALAGARYDDDNIIVVSRGCPAHRRRPLLRPSGSRAPSFCTTSSLGTTSRAAP